ncbi:hypothetical protein IVB30_39170 [Bradyrhizobium sp. 200]|nr:hypothetical protein IVB30_39170 [Bradyrhizobium sp. 200]
MFEHMSNWRELITRLRRWRELDGRMFLHIFAHRSGAYLFDRADGEDWIAQRFLTGGVMPSHHLIRQYADLLEVEKEWRWPEGGRLTKHLLIRGPHLRKIAVCRFLVQRNDTFLIIGLNPFFRARNGTGSQSSESRKTGGNSA